MPCNLRLPSILASFQKPPIIPPAEFLQTNEPLGASTRIEQSRQGCRKPTSDVQVHQGVDFGERSQPLELASGEANEPFVKDVIALSNLGLRHKT